MAAKCQQESIEDATGNDCSSALCSAPHKADYAEWLIMWSEDVVRVKSLVANGFAAGDLKNA